MRITPCGAAGEVTGSAYLVETGEARVLVDCGLFQGEGASDRRNADLGPIDPDRLDSVVLTHAHLDHTGRLPLLPARGFRGNVFCTPATEDFARLILIDSAHLQETDATRTNRKRGPGAPQVTPLYTRADVDRLNPLFATHPLGREFTAAPGVTIRYREAGHILGSASVEMTIAGGPTVVFSGDLGPLHSPILNDFDPPSRADVVFQESTYGGRDHRSLADTVEEFTGILRGAVAGGKKILIPAFAIGRSQQVIYHIAEAVQSGQIPPIPIYLDSPMAIEATRTYANHRNLFDEEARRHDLLRDLQPTLDRLQFVRTAEESKALNDLSGPMVIIAGSGMCDGGRILHHLRNNLDRRDTDVVIVGYQTNGSLGQRLACGAKEVRVLGRPLEVRATIHTIGGFSGHAGQTDLLAWAEKLAAGKPRWYLTHGEEDARRAFRGALEARFGVTAELPKLYDTIDI